MEDIQQKIRRDLINENGLSPLTVDTASPDGSSTTSGTPTPPNGIHDEDWAARYESIEGEKIFVTLYLGYFLKRSKYCNTSGSV